LTVADGADDDYRLGLSGFQLTPVGRALITSFGVPGAEGVIDQSTRTISLEVPFGTDLSSLAPEFALTSGSADQTSGAPPSPTFAVQNPATYTVNDDSTDPETVNEYTVTVTVAPQIGTLVIDLGDSPGTMIEGGGVIGSGPTNLPPPAFGAGSILRSISVDAKLESGENSFASDLTVLFDTTAPLTGDDFSLGFISSGATASFDPAEELSWSGGDAGVGTSLIETYSDTQWTGDIDLADAAVFLGNGFENGDGAWSGTITLSYDDVGGGGSGHASWSGGEPFDEDRNGDGVANGLAFVLGASDPDADALGLLPTVTEGSGGIVLTFQMLDATARGGVSVELEYSTTLAADSWTSVAVPDTSTSVDGVVFAVTGVGPLGVTATIPDSKASDGKLFGRLKAVENAP